MIDATASSSQTRKGCPHPELCPLNQLRVGHAARIKQLSAPPEISRRLREMGFCEEQRVKLLSRESNVICQVCNVRLGISEQLAASIWVELLPAEQRAA
jgi:ferrous iron transport protein A